MISNIVVNIQDHQHLYNSICKIFHYKEDFCAIDPVLNCFKKFDEIFDFPTCLSKLYIYVSNFLNVWDIFNCIIVPYWGTGEVFS